MSVDRQTIVAKVGIAEQELAEAERALDQAIKDLTIRERGQKEILGPQLEAAFARLASARATLVELHKLLDQDDGRAIQ